MRSLTTIIWLLIVTAIGVSIVSPIFDPDLWWHLVAGKWILSHGKIPEVDYWNMHGAGKPWVAYSWLNEILFAYTEINFGFKGLLALKFILSIFSSLILFFSLNNISKNSVVSLTLSIITMCAIHDYLLLRPQTFSWIFFILLITNANVIINKGLTWKNVILQVVIISLWANTNITTFLGIGISLAWVVSNKNLRVGVKDAFIIGIASIFGSFITPYCGKEWLVFYHKIKHPQFFPHIAEFKPTVFGSVEGLLIALLIIVLLLCIREHRKVIHPIQLLIGLGFLVIGVHITKFVPFSVFTLVFLVAQFGPYFPEKKIFEELSILKSISLSLFLLVVIVALGHETVKEKITAPVPTAAVDFYIENNIPAPLLNTFNDGGYLIYRFSDAAGNPRQLVALDGRTNVTDHDVINQAYDALNGKYTWREYLDSIKPKSILWPILSPLYSVLELDPEWCLVYLDSKDKKDSKRWAIWIEAHEISNFPHLPCL